MKVLIVEDDENKRQYLASFVREQIADASIEEARSYRSGLLKSLEQRFDLILLDMSMPTFDIAPGEDGGRPQSLAGREILRQLERRRVQHAVIVVTQLVRFGDDETMTASELDGELRDAHPSMYRGMVYYDATLAGWKGELLDLIRALPSAQSSKESAP